jgi:hypothetical protein
MGRTGLTAAFHCAAIRCHYSGGKQACAKTKDQGRTDSLEHGRSCAGGDLFHSKLLYKIPHCAVNKKESEMADISSLYITADRIYIYGQLIKRLSSNKAKGVINQSASLINPPRATPKNSQSILEFKHGLSALDSVIFQGEVTEHYNYQERISNELRFQRGRRI